MRSRCSVFYGIAIRDRTKLFRKVPIVGVIVFSVFASITGSLRFSFAAFAL